MNTIGSRLRLIRKHFKLTQQEFGKRVFVSASYISKVESGTEIPSDSFIKLVSLEYKTSYFWLLNGSGGMFDSDSISEEFKDFAMKQLPATLKDLEHTVFSINYNSVDSLDLILNSLVHLLKINLSSENLTNTYIECLGSIFNETAFFIDMCANTVPNDYFEQNRTAKRIEATAANYKDTLKKIFELFIIYREKA